MKRYLFALLSVLFFVLPSQAAFPDKPIRFVVAFAPGSSTDIVARLIGEQLTAALGQTVIVENKPGAGGNIATVGVMNAPADGYTLLFHSVAYAVNPKLFTNAGYDAVNDLQGVAMAAFTPNLLYVHPDVKATNLAELLALARTSKMAYASSGNGTTTQLGAEWLFRGFAKVDITHVPFPARCGHQRGGERPGADCLNLHAAGRALCQGRQSAADCRDVAQAQPGFARRAHRGRVGLQRL